MPTSSSSVRPNIPRRPVAAAGTVRRGFGRHSTPAERARRTLFRPGRAGEMFPPERIICLTEETVDPLYLLGEQDRIVGISGYCVRASAGGAPQQATRLGLHLSG